MSIVHKRYKKIQEIINDLIFIIHWDLKIGDTTKQILLENIERLKLLQERL